jgi:hypothetical protein
LNPCYRRERAVSWAGLDDGDALRRALGSDDPPKRAISDSTRRVPQCQRITAKARARFRTFANILTSTEPDASSKLLTEPSPRQQPTTGVRTIDPTVADRPSTRGRSSSASAASPARTLRRSPSSCPVISQPRSPNLVDAAPRSSMAKADARRKTNRASHESDCGALAQDESRYRGALQDQNQPAAAHIRKI